MDPYPQQFSDWFETKYDRKPTTNENDVELFNAWLAGRHSIKCAGCGDVMADSTILCQYCGEF